VLVVTLWSLDVEEREERRDILKDSGQKGREEEGRYPGGSTPAAQCFF